MSKEEEWLLSEKYNGVTSEEFLRDCARLQEGEPLAYLIGHVPFGHITISLSSHPLIPRPETEFWVLKTIDVLRTWKPDARILDLCAGSGCIGTAILKDLPLTQVDFVEIDTHHHETIKENIRQNGIEMSRTSIFGGNLFENVRDTYDVIVSNPPYIDPELDRTEESVRTYEPAIALYGGQEGTELILKIIAESPRHLTQEGVLVLEHEPEHAARISSAARDHGFHSEAFPDQYGTLRYSVLNRLPG